MIDVKDWVGGYPFEVATPDALIGFFAQRHFSLSNSVLRSGIGCNEFAFVRAGAGSDALALAAASSGARG
jgi:2-polyprenyl-6-hydroxyphenyl methylase/3-demethylubiquinone-9 3-methyltransferase